MLTHVPASIALAQLDQASIGRAALDKATTLMEVSLELPTARYKDRIWLTAVLFLSRPMPCWSSRYLLTR